MIVVTGATGLLGHTIVEKLVEMPNIGTIRATCRNPGKANDLMQRGVEIMQADFVAPDTLVKAFEGAAQVFLVSSNARTYGGDPLAQHAAVIEAAKQVGAERIVYTSQIASRETSKFPAARDHAATEKMLTESGVAWTALRNGFYAKSGIMILGDAFKTGVMETTPDGKFSWVSHDDLASAAAKILSDPGRFDGPTPPLTGAEALDFGDLATIASDILGKPIQRNIITADDMRAKIMARGAPAAAADMVLGLFGAAQAGEFQEVNPLLQDLIGSAPRKMKDLMAAHLKG